MLQRTRQKLSQLPWLKLSIPLIALALLLLRIIRPQLQIDAITIGLLAVAFLPWLSTLIESAKLPGGYEFTFRRIEAKQLQQQVEIDTLNFLITHFVTTTELNHLKRLSADQPFNVKRDRLYEKFEEELKHLLAMGFIARTSSPLGGFPALDQALDKEFGKQSGVDVKNHFFVTETGRQYLQLRLKVNPNIPEQE